MTGERQLIWWWANNSKLHSPKAFCGRIWHWPLGFLRWFLAPFEQALRGRRDSTTKNFLQSKAKRLAKRKAEWFILYTFIFFIIYCYSSAV